MRQGGMRPKSHSSGTYWVRANARTGGKKKSEKEEPLDFDGDGKVTIWDYLGWILVWGVVVTWFVFLIILEISL